jgi:hypothetical protein
MNRREFSNRVKAQIVLRAMNERGQIVCEGCGLVLGKRPYHVDHTVPDALSIDKSRPLTADDGKLLGVECCHKPKTVDDVRRIAKSVRQANAHLRIRSPSRMAGNRNSKWKRKIGGGAVLR